MLKAFAQYFTRPVPPGQMRPDDYAGQNVVALLKGRPFNGRYSHVPDAGKWITLTSADAELCFSVFARWAANVLATEGFRFPLGLVPVPNKSAIWTGRRESFPTELLAERVARLLPNKVVVLPVLYWKTALQKASDRGPRDPRILFPALRLHPIEEVELRKQLVLIDDVVTTGGHARACAAKLKRAGYEVRGVIAAGRTLEEQLPDPFRVPLETFPDFDPDPPGDPQADREAS